MTQNNNNYNNKSNKDSKPVTVIVKRIAKKNLIMNYVDLRQNKEYITIKIVNVLYPFKSQ